MATVCSDQRDWAYIFPEAIHMIVEKLEDSFSAFLSFISVCQNWRAVTMEGKEGRKKKCDNMQKLKILRTCRNQLPLLFVETQVQLFKVSRCFFNVPSDGGIQYQLQKHQEDLPNFSYFGSSFGWLLARERQSSDPMVDIVLFNPLAGVVKCLPPRCSEADGRHYIGDCDKGVLSSDPLNDYELVVIHDKFRRLACYRSHTNSWTLMQVGQGYRVVDAVFYGGQIYAITNSGNLLEVNFDMRKTRIVSSNPIPLQDSSCDKTVVPHLVVSGNGQHLLVVEQINVTYFNVFKLCLETWTWVEMNNLGDQALLVGCNTAFYRVRSCFSACVSTLEFPQCLPNCIYYTYGPHEEGKEHRGVFNLGLKQKFGLLCTVHGVGVGYSSYQIWVVPNLKGH